MNIKHSRAIFSLALGALIVSCSSDLSPSEYLDKANTYLAEGQLAAATIETRNAVKGDQENADARLLLGNLLLQSGDAAGAEKELRKAREFGIQDEHTRSMLARALLSQGKLDELLALSPDGLTANDAAHLLVARAMGWFASDELPNARDDAEQALQLDPSSTDAMLALARFDAAENNMASASDRANKILKSAPEKGEAWDFLGDLERFSNQPEKALASYSNAIEYSARPASPMLKRAQINVQLGNTSDALTDLDALTSARVKRPEIQLARGQLKLREGDFVGAQGHFEEALKVEEALTQTAEYTPAVGSLALTHLLSGNLGQAEQYSRRLLTESNESDQARNLLAAVYLENQRFELAEDVVRPVIDSGNIDISSIRLLTTAVLKQDKYDDAVALMINYVRISQASGSGDESIEQSSPVLQKPPSQMLYEETVLSPSDSAAPSDTAAQPFLSDNEQLFVTAVEHLVDGNHNELVIAVKALQDALPDSAAPLNLLGRANLATNELSAARDAFELAAQKDKNNMTARQFLALLDTEAGDIDAARNQLEQIVKAGTQNESVLLQLSGLEAQAGNESAMLEWIEQARSTYPASSASALALARYHAANRNPERALEVLSQLNDNAKNRPDVLQLEGASLILQERFSDALPKLDRLINMQRDIAQWRYLRAIARSGTGDNSGAIEDLNAALEIDPNHAPSQLAMAGADIQQGQLDSAFSRVEALRELIPGSPALEQIEARYEARKAAPVNSATTDEGLASTTIDSTEAALAAARQLWTNDERDKAIRLLTAWLDANPEDFTARLTLANSYIALEQHDAAIEQYETVLRINEQSLPAEARLVTLNNLAWYIRDVDSDRAVDYAQRAVEAAPESMAALDTLAMIHFARDDVQAAKVAFDKATELGVDDPTILFNGATIENALGNTTAASALLKPLVEGNLDFPEAEEAARLYQELQ